MTLPLSPQNKVFKPLNALGISCNIKVFNCIRFMFLVSSSYRRHISAVTNKAIKPLLQGPVRVTHCAQAACSLLNNHLLVFVSSEFNVSAFLHRFLFEKSSCYRRVNPRPTAENYSNPLVAILPVTFGHCAQPPWSRLHVFFVIVVQSNWRVSALLRRLLRNKPRPCRGRADTRPGAQ